MGSSSSCETKKGRQVCGKGKAEIEKLEALPQAEDAVPQLRLGTGMLKDETWATYTPSEFRLMIKKGSFGEALYDYIVMAKDNSIRIIDVDYLIGTYGKPLSKVKVGPTKIGHTSMLTETEYTAVTTEEAALVLYAGHIDITKKGKVAGWSNASGHFQPSVEDHGYMVKVFGLPKKKFDFTKWQQAHQAILNLLFGDDDDEEEGAFLAQGSYGLPHHQQQQYMAPYQAQDHLAAGQQAQFVAPYYVGPQQVSPYYVAPQPMADQGGEQFLIGVVLVALVAMVLMFVGIFGCCMAFAIPRIFGNVGGRSPRKVQYRQFDEVSK